MISTQFQNHHCWQTEWSMLSWVGLLCSCILCSIFCSLAISWLCCSSCCFRSSSVTFTAGRSMLSAYWKMPAAIRTLVMLPAVAWRRRERRGSTGLDDGEMVAGQWEQEMEDPGMGGTGDAGA